MTGRATTQAIAATDRTEGDSDAVRIRHQLDAWANASTRTPRLVATPAEDLGVERQGAGGSGDETQPRRCSGRPYQGHRATKAVKAKGTEATN